MEDEELRDIKVCLLIGGEYVPVKIATMESTQIVGGCTPAAVVPLPNHKPQETLVMELKMRPDPGPIPYYKPKCLNQVWRRKNKNSRF